MNIATNAGNIEISRTVRMNKLLEALAPPSDCITCSNLNMDQTMPLTDPPIPIAYCPKACSDDDIDQYDEEASKYWAHETDRCPCYSKEMTRDEMKELIKELQEEIGAMCDDCDERMGDPPDYCWRD